MPLTQSLPVSDLICHRRQHLNLFQEKFAATLGVSIAIVNRREKGHSLPSPLTLKLIKNVLKSMEERGQVLLRQSFLEGESDA